MLDRDAITYALVTGDVELAKDSVAFSFLAAPVCTDCCVVPKKSAA
jgi:hypothetical protein